MSMTHEPIKQEVIESMIKRHGHSYYKIGDLYSISMRTWQTNEFGVVPLLDYSIHFDYNSYLEICKFGKTLPKNRYTYYPDATKLITPYHICFNYSYLFNNQKHVRDMKTQLHDPIFHKQTMNTKIISFIYECMKVVRKYEEKD